MKNTFVWSDYYHGVSFKISGLSPDMYEDESNPLICVTLGHVFIQMKIPNWLKPNHSYGFQSFDGYLHCFFGSEKHQFSWQLPWSWQITRVDLLKPDGSVLIHNDRKTVQRPHRVPGVKTVYWNDVFNLESFNPPKLGMSTADTDSPIGEVYPFKWVLKDGTIQETKVMLLGIEREWRWKWFQRLPFPRLINRSVEINFQHEVGEKAGSWKGGLMGTSCPLQKGEPMCVAFDKWVAKWNGC